eukprot:GHVU01113630.1.p2 GENE.GHVU01113630.1~~GHVU01113630.1.p2  ORF type:complete len:281 (+),score=12.97 GHVU01113630.1:1554-2396(+)
MLHMCKHTHVYEQITYYMCMCVQPQRTDTHTHTHVRAHTRTHICISRSLAYPSVMMPPETAGSECQPLDVGDRVATISHPHRICANNHICEAASLRPYKPIFGQACQNNLTTPAEFDNAPKTQFKCDRRMDCRCFYGVWNHGTTKQQWYTGGGCATELVPQQDSVAFVPVKGSVYFKTYPGMTCSESNSYVPMEYLDVHPAPPMFPDDGNCVTRCRELWGCTCVFLHRDRDPPECHLYFETIGYPLPAFGNGTSNGTAVVIASDDETTETCESEEGKSWP